MKLKYITVRIVFEDAKGKIIDRLIVTVDANNESALGDAIPRGWPVQAGDVIRFVEEGE